MWSKCIIVLLLVAFENLNATEIEIDLNRLLFGQFFRKDYKYINILKTFYKINKYEKTWSQGNIQCLREGATLFYPENIKEAIAVRSLWSVDEPKINEIYIGVANWNSEGRLETIDGKPLTNIYHKWAVGEPNNKYGNNSCVVMKRDGTLKMSSCSNARPYICKKKLSTVQWNADCNLPDPGYIYNKDLDRCYKFHLDPQNWTDAYLTCDAEESYLAIINSPEEDRYFINITAAAPKDDVQGDYLRGAVHLGFQNKTGIWQTIKGELLEVSGFGGGWANDQPDGQGNESCGSMFYTGELNDIGCWQRMFFICEHEIDRRAFRTGH